MKPDRQHRLELFILMLASLILPAILTTNVSASVRLLNLHSIRGATGIHIVKIDKFTTQPVKDGQLGSGSEIRPFALHITVESTIKGKSQEGVQVLVNGVQSRRKSAISRGYRRADDSEWSVFGCGAEFRDYQIGERFIVVIGKASNPLGIGNPMILDSYDEKTVQDLTDFLKGRKAVLARGIVPCSGFRILALAEIAEDFHEDDKISAKAKELAISSLEKCDGTDLLTVTEKLSDQAFTTGLETAANLEDNLHIVKQNTDMVAEALYQCAKRLPDNGKGRISAIVARHKKGAAKMDKERLQQVTSGRDQEASERLLEWFDKQ